jgi:ABC-type Fe3+ transport system substrate-binding protein
VITVPAWAQPKVTYAMAVVTDSPNQAAAAAFIKEVLSKAGQAKLESFGFLPLVKPVEKIATKPSGKKRKPTKRKSSAAS